MKAFIAILLGITILCCQEPRLDRDLMRGYLPRGVHCYKVCRAIGSYCFSFGFRGCRCHRSCGLGCCKEDFQDDGGEE